MSVAARFKISNLYWHSESFLMNAYLPKTIGSNASLNKKKQKIVIKPSDVLMFWAKPLPKASDLLKFSVFEE